MLITRIEWSLVRIYLDLETYRPKKENAFTDEKIIIIGVLKDETRFEETNLPIEPSHTILSEKSEGSEKHMVETLQSFVRDALATHRFTLVVGFNILRFDIPLLISKGTQMGLGSSDTLTQFWHNTFTIDYFQLLLPANGMQFKELSFPNIVRVSQELGLNPPGIVGQSEDIAGLYENGKLDEITAHMMQDLKIVRWLDLYGAKRLLKLSVENGVPLFRPKE